ncbi:glycosyltransferase family 2 protein [Bizionia sediminis]|uniref:Glycosyltransferase family 2 protein n=1 Tax=Bizionia sediminis TaxID=1737064 RepID=A0ABW5KN28_9FLAO
MSVQPLVSIIIPTFNRAHLIGETLDSVLAQTYTNWECIVVDDGSTDGTEALLKNYTAKDRRFQYHKRPDNHLPGGNGARNYGFEVSSGEYIQWFDSDDIMLSSFLCKKYMKFSNKVNIVFCTGFSVDKELKNKQLKQLPLIKNLFKEYVCWQTNIMLPSLMVKRSFLVEKSLFNENLLRGQENDFFSRLFYKLNTEDYTILNEGLYLYRQHSKSKSYEDKQQFVKGYKESLFQVSLNNLNRGIVLNDLEIINYHYQIIIHYLFDCIYNKELKLGWSFLLKIARVFAIYAKLFTAQLWFWISLFLLSSRTIYKVEKRIKNKIFK